MILKSRFAYFYNRFAHFKKNDHKSTFLVKKGSSSSIENSYLLQMVSKVYIIVFYFFIFLLISESPLDLSLPLVSVIINNNNIMMTHKNKNHQNSNNNVIPSSALSPLLIEDRISVSSDSGLSSSEESDLFKRGHTPPSPPITPKSRTTSICSSSPRTTSLHSE